MSSYKKALFKVPETMTDWEDVIRIANNKLPVERNYMAEDWVVSEYFIPIYGRYPEVDIESDVRIVSIMTYGLRPGKRNMRIEKENKKIFESIFGRKVETNNDWDAIRGMTYGVL